MAPNSRPPLTSRIRASFDGKRTRSAVSSPTHTNGFITQDPDSLRTAIDEAINSETFQKAIAANLAKLIKPSIKSALDTIQPVVEAVYSHELLLRKTNQSVEDILLRLDSQGVTASRRESIVEPLDPEPNWGVPTTLPDGGDGGGKTPTQETPEPRARDVSTSGPDLTRQTKLLVDNHAKTTSSLAGISSSVEASNNKLAEALQGISDVDTKLRWTSDSMESLKSASEQSHTTMAVLQAQLDQLKDDIGQLMTAVGTDLGKNVQALSQQSGAKDASLDAHTTKLDTISTDLAALKDHSETDEKIDTVATELSLLRSKVEAGIISNSEEFTGLGSQINTVLSTLEGHTSTLGEIKDKGPHPEILAALQQSNDSHATHAVALSEIKDRSVSVPAAEAESPETATALQDLKSDLTSLRDNIEAGLTSNSESIGAKVDNVLATIESHKASDPGSDILAAVQQSNESHASHAAVLEELRSRDVVSAPATAIDTSELTAQLNTVSETINSHTAVLEELRSREAAPAAAIDTSELMTQLNSLSETINSHTTTLDEIKASGGSHASALEELKSREAAPAPTASVDTSDLTAQLSTLSETIHSHTATLDEIRAAYGSHSAALETHGSALEGLRSINIATVPESVAETEVSTLAPLEAHMSSIVSILEEHSEVLNEIKTATGAHTSALESHGTTLEDIKSLNRDIPNTPVVDNSGLEAQVAGLASTLESHTSVLDEIKATGSAHTAVLGEINTHNQTHATALRDLQPLSQPSSTDLAITDQTGLSDIMTTIVETLELHTTLLNEMKEDVSAEILTTLHDISQGQAGQNNLLAEIREADLSDEVLTLLHASAESHESHTASLEELKSRSVDPVSAPAAVDMSGVETKIDSMVTALEEHKVALSEIKDTASASHELHTAQGAVLEEIKSKSVESTSAPATDLSGLEEQLGGITAALAEVKELHAAHGASLDEIKSRSVDSVPAPTTDLSGLEAQLSSISAALDEHKSTLSEVKDLHTTHGASLEEIKSRSVEPALAPTIDLSGMETQLAAVSASLEEHKSVFSDIKLTTLASYELNKVHASSLEDIRARSIDPSLAAPAIDISSLEAQIGSIISSINEVKAKSLEPAASAVPVDLSGLEAQLAGLTSMLEEHKATLAEVQETNLASHAAHATSLDEIKSRSFEPTSVDLSGVEAKLSVIAAELDEHKSVLAKIADATAASNISHTAHTAALSDIKDATSSWNEAHSANAFTLAEIKDATLASNESHMSHAVALSELKDATAHANEAHASHTAAFAELKSIQPTETATPESVDLSPIEGHLTAIISTLEGQNSNLIEIKEASSHEDILANISELKSLISETHAEHGTLIKDLHTETKDSRSHLAETIGALALGGAAGAGATALVSEDSSDEKVLSEVQSMRSVLEATKEKVDSVAAQIDINHTTITTSITTLSDELKAEIDATGTDITDHVVSMKNDISSIDLNSFRNVETKLEGLESSVKQTGSFVVGLYEGVHLNDTGVGQLQEQLVTWIVKGRAAGSDTPPVSGRDGERSLQIPLEMDEATWFKQKGPGSKRAVSPSPLREVESISPPAELQDEEEEEMPSIGKVLGVAAGLGLGGAAAVGVGSLLSNGEEKKGETADEAAVTPMDESKEIGKPAPVEPEISVDDTPIPEATKEEEPIKSEPLSEKEIEQPEEIAEGTAIPDIVEESAPVEPKPEPVTEPDTHIEEAAIPEVSEESLPVEKETKDVQESVPAEIGESVAAEPEPEPEAGESKDEEVVEDDYGGAEESTLAADEPKDIGGPMPEEETIPTDPEVTEAKDETPEELIEDKEVEEPTPVELEQAESPAIEEDSKADDTEETKFVSDVPKEIEEPTTEEETIPTEPAITETQDEISEESIESKDIDGSAQVEPEQTESPEIVGETPAEAESVAEIKEAEASAPHEEPSPEESIIPEPEQSNADLEHESTQTKEDEPEIETPKNDAVPETIEESTLVENEEQIEHDKDIDELIPHEVAEIKDESSEEPIETNDVEEPTPVQEEAPVESETTPEIKEPEDSTPHEEISAVEGVAIPDAENSNAPLDLETSEAKQDEPEAEVSEEHIAPGTVEESTPVESEEPVEPAKDIQESTLHEPETSTEELPASSEEPEHESILTEGIEHPEVDEKKAQIEESIPSPSTPLQKEPVNAEEETRDEVLKDDKEPIVPAVNGEHIHENGDFTPDPAPPADSGPLDEDVKKEEPLEHVQDDTPEIETDAPVVPSSDDTKELVEETLPDPEPTPTAISAEEEVSHEEEHVPETTHIEPEQPITEDESHTPEDLNPEPASSPFIEEPEPQPAAQSEPENSPASPDFQEPLFSPISEYHSAQGEDESTPHGTEEAPLDSPVQSHSVPYAGLNADEEEEEEDGDGDGDENPFEDPDNVITPSDMLSTVDDREDPVAEIQHLEGLEEVANEREDDEEEEDNTPPAKTILEEDHPTQAILNGDEETENPVATTEHDITPHGQEDPTHSSPTHEADEGKEEDSGSVIHHSIPNGSDEKEEETLPPATTSDPPPTKQDNEGDEKEEEEESDPSPAFSGGFA